MAANLLNPIERRLAQVETFWNEFAKSRAARLLCWHADSDNARLVEMFVESQAEESGVSPDLFLPFEVPFHDANTYGFKLREALLAMYDADREALEQAGVDAGWNGAVVKAGDTGHRAFGRCCGQLYQYYSDIIEHAVVWLCPSEIADAEAFESWLRELLLQQPPEQIRIMVIDSDTTPILTDLSAENPEIVQVVELDLQMPDARLELARGAGPMDEVAQFRHWFVALSESATNGDLRGAERCATEALRIARSQHWPQMAAAVSLALGSAYLGCDDLESSLVNYRRAGRAAARAKADGRPEGAKLVVQCHLAEGAALVKAEDYAQAAELYERTAPLAQSIADKLIALECWRMAAFSYDQAGEPDPAWRCGCEAIDVGAQLQESERLSSTLAYAGDHLLRLAETAPFQDRHDSMQQRMNELLGPDWRAAVA